MWAVWPWANLLTALGPQGPRRSMRSVPTTRGRTRGLNGISEAEGSAEVAAPHGASAVNLAVLFTALGQHLARRQEQGCLAEGSSRRHGGGCALNEERSRPCALPRPPLQGKLPRAPFTLPDHVNARPDLPKGSSLRSPLGPHRRPAGTASSENPARAPGTPPRPELADSLVRPGEPWTRGCGAGRPRPGARRWPAASPGPTRWAPCPRARPGSRPPVRARPGAQWAQRRGWAAPLARPDLSDGPGPAPCGAAAALSAAPPGSQLSHRIPGRTHLPRTDTPTAGAQRP